MNKDLLTIQEAAGILRVSTKTLRRWDKAGSLIPQRTSGNQRRYTKNQIDTFKKQRDLPYAYPSALSGSEIPPSRSPSGHLEGVAERLLPGGNRFNKFVAPNIFKVSAFVFGLSICFGLLAFSLSGNMGKGQFGLRDVILNSFQDLGSESNEMLKLVQHDNYDKKTGGEVLQASTIDNTLLFNVNIPSAFNDSADFLEGLHAVKIATLSGGIITENEDIDAGTGTLTASNVLYGATAGTGISIGTGQNPTITNTDLGSSQNIFKTIKVGSSSFSSGSNTDTLELAAGSNITLSADTSNKKVTITGSSVTASGWTDDGTTVRLSTSTDSVGIGTTSPLAALDVVGAATVSGNLNLYGAARSIQATSNNSLTIGGSTTGNLIFSPLNGSGTLRITSLTSCDTIDTDSNGVLSCGTDTGGSGSTNWRLASGAISPINDTFDVLVGNIATTSAKFGVLNVNSGTPTATISANSGNIATYLTGDGTLATTNRQTLTIGNSSAYNTTGNVLINPNGTGLVGIGTASPGQRLSIGDGTNIIHDISTAAGGATVFNEFGIDNDFRIESDTNANMFVLDAGLNHIGVGAVAIAGAGFGVDQAAETTTQTNFVRMGVDNTNAITTNTGNTSVFSLFVDEPNITVGTATPTNAASLYVQDAPTEATNNYALWVDAGVSRFDGNVQVNADSTTVSNLITATAGSATVFNEASADIDFRIESDTNANMFVLDAGLNHIGVGAVAIAGAGFGVDQGAETTTQTNFARMGVDNTNAITTNTGNTSVFSLFVDEPNITVGTATPTNAASLYVQDAPTEATNNYALWVDVGVTRTDDDIVITDGASTPLDIIRLDSTAGGATVFNEQGADINFRIESDTNAAAVVLDSGLFAGVGQLSIGAAAQGTATGFMVIDNPNITATANLPFSKVAIDNTRIVTVPTGTASIVASLFVDEPNITATGTVTNAATLYIQAAPTEGSNNYSLFVDVGTSRFDGPVAFDAQQTLTANSTTPSVSGGSHFTTANTTNPTLISNFTNGANGQLIVIELGDSVTDFDCTASNLNCGGTDITAGATGDIFTFMYDGTNWNLINWMDTSATQTGADIAEYFPSDEDLQGGDLVAVDTVYPVRVKKTTTPHEQQLIGIVSTQPGITLGDPEKDGRYPVALAGRVPVKVSLENGEILAGDYLTSSSTPGVAMKAIKPGRVIGVALEAFDGNNPTSEESRCATSEVTGTGSSEVKCGKILVFVNLSWHDPSIYIAADGNLQSSVLSSQLSDNGQSVISQSETDEQITDKLESENGQQKTDNSSIDLASDPLFKDLSDKVALLETRINNLADTAFSASTSALLSEIQQSSIEGIGEIAPAAFDAGEIKDATISGTLMVLGRTTLSDLGVTGNINAGLLSINGIEGAIYTLAGDLKLQSLGLGGIDILAGKVMIDTKGNIVTEGQITAKKVNIDTKDKEAASIGSGKITASQTSVAIFSTSATEKSKIFVTATTPTGKQSLFVKEKTAGVGFTVSIEEPYNKDIAFDWWVVN